MGLIACSSRWRRNLRCRKTALARLGVNVLALLAVFATSAVAQVSSGGTPPSFTKSLRSDVERIDLGPVDVARLLAEDAAERDKAVPFRFGHAFDVNWSIDDVGTWEDLPDGGRVWRLTVATPGAYSINMVLSRYRLPEGAQLFVYNVDRSMVVGAFTSKNNKPTGEMAIQPVRGDEVTIEYYEPAAVVYEGELVFAHIVHAYRDIFRIAKDATDFGGSGSCNNNVNCPEGANWQKEKRSVAMILLSNGTRYCSGSMVNNVRQDKTPYFLTANHCASGPTTWIIMFNYESPSCANINGPTFMTVQGTTVRASYSTSDVFLVQLNEAPPDSYKVTFGGWSNVNAGGDSSVAIHHPAGDIKKISFDYGTITSTAYLGETVDPAQSHWRITQWEDGTTEGGSSGSPLYNKQHQVVGQLHGGYASCTSITSDWYGKFSMSWTGGGTSSSRLRDWLDPDNTGATTLNTWDPYAGVQIVHTPLSDTKDAVNPYPVVAQITADAAMNPDSMFLKYSIGVSNYTNLLVATGNPNQYAANIPAQAPGTVVNYFLEAHAVNGKADTTDVYSFKVIDYNVLLTPSLSIATGAVDDTVWHSFTATNDGVFNDNLSLTLLNADWPTTLWDNAQTTQISSTGSLAPNATYSFKARVIVPISVYGQGDTATVRATSGGNPLMFKSSTLRTTSAGQPLTVPFYDDFPATTVDPAKWVQATNVTIDAVGITEPSEPYSVRLNGNPTGADTLMSQAIDLNVVGGVNVVYSYERQGGGDKPETGDDLIVEYFTNVGTWAELSRQLGSGPAMTSYATVTVGVPTNGYHSAFRLRFRSIAQTGAFDDWFIDNISVDFGPTISPNPATMNVSLYENDSTVNQLMIQNTGLGSLTYSMVVVPDLSKSLELFNQLQSLGLTHPASYPVDEFDRLLYNEIKGAEGLAPKGPEIVFNAGGPDAFGYYWLDSDEPGGPNFNWIDISGTGTDVIGGLNDDNFVGPFPIGFVFPYYDSIYTQFYISSNGYIGFGPTTNYNVFTNTPVPDTASPNNVIYWCWDDLNPDDPQNTSGKVLYQNVGGDLVISFIDYPEYDGSVNPGDVITAQVILSPSGNIKLQYLSFGSGFVINESTTGVENKNGTIGLQIALNNNYIKPNLAVEIAKPKTWAFPASSSGSVPPGQADTVGIKFVSAGLDTGVYKATLKISSNDPLPANNPYNMPLKLTVMPPPPPYTCGDSNADDAVSIADAVFVIEYIFSGGPAPDPVGRADVDCSGAVSIADAVYLIEYIFSGGAAPCAACP